jgi:hypothetical protein
MCEGVDKPGLGGWLGGRMRRTQEVQGGGVKGIRKTIGQEGGETQRWEASQLKNDIISSLFVFVRQLVGYKRQKF